MSFSIDTYRKKCQPLNIEIFDRTYTTKLHCLLNLRPKVKRNKKTADRLARAEYILVLVARFAENKAITSAPPKSKGSAAMSQDNRSEISGLTHTHTLSLITRLAAVRHRWPIPEASKKLRALKRERVSVVSKYYV